MTIPFWVELVCASCSKAEIGQYVFNGRVPIRKMKETAVSRGWLFNHNEAFCSADCKAHFEGERK